MVSELLLSHSEVLRFDELYKWRQIEEESDDLILQKEDVALFHNLKSRAMFTEYYYPNYYSTNIDAEVPQYVKDYSNIRQ